jgi:hypothetical protein
LSAHSQPHHPGAPEAGRIEDGAPLFDVRRHEGTVVCPSNQNDSRIGDLIDRRVNRMAQAMLLDIKKALHFGGKNSFSGVH